MSEHKYRKPQVKTMTVHEILETLGPVSCGSGAALGTPGSGQGTGTTPAGAGLEQLK